MTDDQNVPEGSTISSNDLTVLAWLSRDAVRDPRGPRLPGPLQDHVTFPIRNVYARQQLVERAEMCPECGDDLDTGWECGECNADFRALEEHAQQVEGGRRPACLVVPDRVDCRARKVKR